MGMHRSNAFGILGFLSLRICQTSSVLLSVAAFPQRLRRQARIMDDLDMQAFQASVSKTDVERVLRRIQGHQGVIALMVANRDGLIMRSNLDLTTTKLYALQYQNLINVARSAVRELDPQNELCFIRVRNKRHEIMVAPTEDLVLIVVQLIEKIPERVHGAAFD
ncbi:dynein light chain roadblock-type 2-like [Stylophora pistillata]|uniref:dynein light chain roadblock-type 2-like n=1 Tax=Stylophora pistillata TaxID=50429 RepID=UPI000C050272|nr:dynein light chain roadblock-type 2-like [Stylophora pistillata]